jgi:acyl-CoA hydrolase
MEIFVDVWVEDRSGKNRFKANTAIYIFAALDKDGKKRKVPELVPETDEEIKKYEGALRRREMSLILAGKLKPKQATQLRALFE